MSEKETEEEYAFLIRINYNSGIQEEFWCSSFKYNDKKYEWISLSDKKRPIDLFHVKNAIESIWQVDYMKLSIYEKKYGKK